LAQFLNAHPAVEKMNYPGLESHPAYLRTQELFDGCGGMLSFELKGSIAAVKRFMKKISIPIIAPSLGGVETLISRPAITSHSRISPADREQLGISDSLIRVSVGLENANDLISDFKQALN